MTCRVDSFVGMVIAQQATAVIRRGSPTLEEFI
jgi:hypothetical protein